MKLLLKLFIGQCPSWCGSNTPDYVYFLKEQGLINAEFGRYGSVFVELTELGYNLIRDCLTIRKKIDEVLSLEEIPSLYIPLREIEALC